MSNHYTPAEYCEHFPCVVLKKCEVFTALGRFSRLQGSACRCFSPELAHYTTAQKYAGPNSALNYTHPAQGEPAGATKIHCKGDGEGAAAGPTAGIWKSILITGVWRCKSSLPTWAVAASPWRKGEQQQKRLHLLRGFAELHGYETQPGCIHVFIPFPWGSERVKKTCDIGLCSHWIYTHHIYTGFWGGGVVYTCHWP